MKVFVYIYLLLCMFYLKMTETYWLNVLLKITLYLSKSSKITMSGYSIASKSTELNYT